MTYLVTFYSQFDSNQFYRNFSKLGEVVRKPVPRELSSSCGTCCTFKPNDDADDIMKLLGEAELEKVYLVTEPKEDKEEPKAKRAKNQAGRKVNYTLLLEKE